MEQIINTISGWVWSPALVAICLLAGLYFSIGTRFVQVRRIGEMARLLFSTDKSQKTGITSFQAFSMALSGRVGTGNIVGVATAIGYGGPGAIVWMWIIAFLGAGSAFSEATLSQIYKEEHKGQFRGGPAYYIEKGLHSKWLAVIFAVIAVVACGWFLPPVQSNGIAISFANTLHVNPAWVGAVVALLIGLVVMGGVKRIANVAQIVAPFMAIVYVLLSIVVLAFHIREVPHAFMDMIQSAFGMKEAFGGILGATISWGVKRGIYSNEAGQGTGAIVAAAARVSHPVKQGLVQAFSVYIDTLLVCTATAMMILACRTYNIIDSVQQTASGAVVSYLQQNPLAPEGEPGVFYTTGAIGTVVGPRAGDMIISTALFFFAFTTIMAYYYYAETNLVYLFNRWRRRQFSKHPEQLDQLERADAHFGDDRSEKVVVWVMRIATISAVLMGSMMGSGLVWTLGDIGVGTMAWINVVAILLLSPKALRSLRDYERQKKQGLEPRFDPDALGIKEADYWQQKA